MELPEFQRRLETFFAAGRCLSHGEAREALKLTDVLERFTRFRAEAAVQANPLEPAVLMHMNDGWGAWCNTFTSKP